MSTPRMTFEQAQTPDEFIRLILWYEERNESRRTLVPAGRRTLTEVALSSSLRDVDALIAEVRRLRAILVDCTDYTVR